MKISAVAADLRWNSFFKTLPRGKTAEDSIYSLIFFPEGEKNNPAFPKYSEGMAMSAETSPYAAASLYRSSVSLFK